MKKTIAMLCTALFAALGAFADTWTDPETGIEWTYYLTDNGAVVGSGRGSGTAIPLPTIGEIVIPSTLGGCPVKSIEEHAFSDVSSCSYGWMAGFGSWFDGDLESCCSRITSVTIPEGVESIGSSAFLGCSGLTRVTMPNSVTSIGNGAFKGCTSLKNVTWSTSITNIANCAFQCCTSLASVSIPNGVRYIGKDAFSYCDNLKTVYVAPGDSWRIANLYFWDSGIVFKESGSPSDNVVDASFDGSSSHTFNGLVYDTDGVVCGIVQVTTGKATKKGVKVGGFVILEDGKKQTIKSSTVAIQDGYVKVSTKVGKLGTAAITVGGDGFKGTLGHHQGPGDQVVLGRGGVKGESIA